MRAIHSWAFLLAAILLSSGASPLAKRAAPSVMMIYGGPLGEPVFIVQREPSDMPRYATFWGGESRSIEPAQLTERAYFNIAIFWLPWTSVSDVDRSRALLAELEPEEAHQHGRLYVATREIGAAVVTTDYVRFDPTSRAALPRPVPADLGEFKYGAWLDQADIEIAQRLQIPLQATSSNRIRAPN